MNSGARIREFVDSANPGINSGEKTKARLGECEIRQGFAREFVRASGIGTGREILRRVRILTTSGWWEEGAEVEPEGERNRTRERESDRPAGVVGLAEARTSIWQGTELTVEVRREAGR